MEITGESVILNQKQWHNSWLLQDNQRINKSLQLLGWEDRGRWAEDDSKRDSPCSCKGKNETEGHTLK